jgi:hypothetical protein
MRTQPSACGAADNPKRAPLLIIRNVSRNPAVTLNQSNSKGDLPGSLISVTTSSHPRRAGSHFASGPGRRAADLCPATHAFSAASISRRISSLAHSQPTNQTAAPTVRRHKMPLQSSLADICPSIQFPIRRRQNHLPRSRGSRLPGYQPPIIILTLIRSPPPKCPYSRNHPQSLARILR